MFRILTLCAFLAAVSAVIAQMPAVLDDAMATPDAYFNHDIVLHDVFAGDLFRMNIEASTEPHSFCGSRTALEVWGGHREHREPFGVA